VTLLPVLSKQNWLFRSIETHDSISLPPLSSVGDERLPAGGFRYPRSGFTPHFATLGWRETYPTRRDTTDRFACPEESRTVEGLRKIIVYKAYCLRSRSRFPPGKHSRRMPELLSFSKHMENSPRRRVPRRVIASLARRSLVPSQPFALPTREALTALNNEIYRTEMTSVLDSA
jgi:hypothetical protein